MPPTIALAPHTPPTAPSRWHRVTLLWERAASHPSSINRILLVCWFVTRAILLANLVLGQHYADPAFYNDAGQLALARFPYLNYPVEYPPLAMVLLLLPALPLLPFRALAPRPVPSLNGPSNLILGLPSPDPVRYGAYGVSFAIEMLIIDVLTLWLIRLAARRLFKNGQAELSAGLIYVALIFISGALLQKFDLAMGMLTLAALLALWSGRARTAWVLLAMAILVKGFPILLVPIFAIALAQRSGRTASARAFVVAIVRGALQGALWCGGTVVAVTMLVVVWAGWQPVVRTITYHSSRGLEVESMYANLALVLGGIPGLEALTPFDADGLSRAVTSPLTPALIRSSDVIMVLVILLVYLAYACSVMRFSVPSLWPPSNLLRRLVRERRQVPLAGTAATVSHVADVDRGMGELIQPSVASTHTPPSPPQAPTLDMEAAPPWAMASLLASLGLLLAFLATFRALPAHYLLDVVPLVPLVAPAQRRLAVIWSAGPLVFALCGGAIISFWEAFLAQEAWAVALMTLRNLGWLAMLVLVCGALASGSVAQGTARVLRAPTDVAALLARWREHWMRLAAQATPIPGFRPRGEDAVAHLFSAIDAIPLLIGAGVSSLVLYVALVATFPLPRWAAELAYRSGSPAAHTVGPLTRYSPVAALGFALLIIALFLLQFVALLAVTRLAATRPSAGRIWGVRGGILAFPVIAAMLLLWMQPITSATLYGYVARGYALASLHQSPIGLVATQLPGGLSFGASTAAVGPLWLLISWGIMLVTSQSLLASMVVFKIVLALCLLGCVLLVDALAGKYFPARRLRIDVLFGWSPLLLFETVANGHVEIVVGLLILFGMAILAFRRARVAAVLAFGCFILAALVDDVALLLLPLWLAYVLPRPSGALIATVRGQWRGQRRVRVHIPWRGAPLTTTLTSIAAILLGLVVTVLCCLPLWQGPQTFRLLIQPVTSVEHQGSFVAVVLAFLSLIVTASVATALVKTFEVFLVCVFGVYVIAQAYQLWHRPDADLPALLTTTAKIAFAGLIVVTFSYQPWYVLLLLPLAALATEPFVRRAAVILALSSLLAYAISGYVLVNQHGAARDLIVRSVEVLITFAPLLFLRAAPYEGGVLAIARRYAHIVEGFVRVRIRWQERMMLALVLVVAALLRLLRLGNLLSPISGIGSPSDALVEVSGNLHLVLSDPRGLSLPFIWTYQAIVALLGPTPLAMLLPSAVLGTLTVFVIYLLTREIMHQGGYRTGHIVGILAALLAATSRWHVALSRSGMEVVILPLLMCTALYWLLRALHASAISARFALSGSPAQWHSPRARRLRRTAALYAIGAGICTGLACDLAPGLWGLPFLVLGILAVWRWRRPTALRGQRRLMLFLVGSAVIAGLPTVGYFASQVVGLPEGSPILARSSVSIPVGPSPLTGTFWAQVVTNLGTVMHLLLTQDYSATYPAVGGAPIIPAVLTPIFVVGVILLIVRWRNPASLALLLLLAMPMIASVAVGTPPSVIAAASILPAICIVPALAIVVMFDALGHLPIVVDRISGTRIFTTPQQIGRILLLLFLLISTARTFFWYFEATLPAHALDQAPTSQRGSPPSSAVLPPQTPHDTDAYILVQSAADDSTSRLAPPIQTPGTLGASSAFMRTNVHTDSLDRPT